MKSNFFLRLVSVAALLAGGSVNLLGQTSVDSVVTSNLFEPYGIAATIDGTSYITDGANHRIVKVANGGTVATLLAGQTGVPGTNDGFVEFAHFNFPQGIVFARGGLVVADSANHTLRFVSLNGQVTTLAGEPGAYGFVNGPAGAARFRYPLGLATDADGNIFIADSQNNAIRKLDTNNNVTTVASGFFQPAGLTVGDNGDLWVADTRRHCIKVVSTNGTVTLVAGVPNVSGTSDSLLATNAQFSSPRALLWVSATSGILISDSGNHTIRRLFWNTNYNTYSVETFAGVPGVSGAQNGSALSATFNSPVGLSFDQFSGGFLVVDKANNQVRRINTGVVQIPVVDPQIGWIEPTLVGLSYFGVFHPVVSAVFNNEVVVAIVGEDGTQTYYTLGDTPSNPLEDNIPNPAVGFGNTPPPAENVIPISLIPPSITPPQPDVTIKAIGTLTGRRSSSIVRARFQFQVANPFIVGDNAASFKILNITTNAEMWYTWDGSEPTNNALANTNVFGPVFDGQIISFNIGESNRTFKIRGFRNGFQPSDVFTKVFQPDNFAANSLSLGFASGEASSDFVGAAGQRFYAPVTLEVLPGQKVYSLQYNVVTTNLTGTAIDPTTVAFEPMVVKPVGDGVYIPIPAAMSLDGSAALTTLIVSNP
ncbi:MAG TPA: hypothetical protein VNT99_14525, partial [Methylomirabilota bacterium]|nr:hypothetical protein [Methylomirabilota bacterium]